MVKGPNKEFVDLWGGRCLTLNKFCISILIFSSRNLRVIGGKCLSFVNR